MKRMGINDFSGAQAQEFVNAFRNSIPKKAREILNKRLLRLISLKSDRTVIHSFYLPILVQWQRAISS